jgi:hypothetical protein
MLMKICELNKDDYKEYLKLMKKNNVYENLLSNTLPRKIKKILVKVSPRIYYSKKLK